MSNNPVSSTGSPGPSWPQGPAGRPGQQGPSGPSGPRGIPHDPDVTGELKVKQREKARLNIAFLLIAFYLLLITAPLIGWLIGIVAFDEAIKMITTISSVLSGIVGAIVVFYFRGE